MRRRGRPVLPGSAWQRVSICLLCDVFVYPLAVLENNRFLRGDTARTRYMVLAAVAIADESNAATGSAL